VGVGLRFETFSRRSPDLVLAASLAQAQPSGPVDVVIDATGLKVYDAGETGVTSRFAQNRTLSGKGHEIRPFHKRRYSDELSPLRQI